MLNNISKKRILVTGASGFVGYNVCNYFLKKGWDVFGLANSGIVPKGVKLIKIDLLDYKKIKSEIKKVNPYVVLHLGAYVVLDRTFEVAQKCIDVNIQGTLNLLESIKDLALKKFIFFSTEEVYGDNRIPYKENQITRPPSPYAISKIAGENLSLLYYKLYNLPVVIFRIATIFGPYQPVSRFIPGIIIKSIKEEKILLNSGNNKRDYLFVDELIKVIDRAIMKKEAIGEVFNIAGAEILSGKELAQRIVKLSGNKSEIVFNVFPDREGEAKIWEMDSSKAKKILDWHPKQTINTGMEKTLSFYKKYK